MRQLDARVRSGQPEFDLPSCSYTKSGLAYDPGLDLWAWRDGPFRVHIDFETLPENFKQFKLQLKHCLKVFVGGHSPSYATNLFGAFLHFARANRAFSASAASITQVEIGNYAATLDQTRNWRVGALNPLLQKWFSLGLTGIDEACVDYLRGRRKPGNTKGSAVRTRDPDIGPFSDAEFQAVFRAIEAAHHEGSITLWANLLVRLLAACGGRPSQYAALKIQDFTPAVRGGSAMSPAVLALPSIKNGLAHARKDFLEFELSEQTAQLLSEHISHLITHRGAARTSALFPLGLLRLSRENDSDRSPNDYFLDHPTGASLSGFLDREIGRFAPASERTAYTPISLSPRRFRYTFGTRMAEEGASRAVIADRLGHTDLQNVQVYFEASPAIVDNIDKAMGAALAPIALAFKGRVIGEEQQATFKGAAGTRIVDFRVSGAPIGNCAKGGGCALAKPVACYTCHRFEPWLDGPHEEVLQLLLKERERCADERIAGVNDDAIAAVNEAIAECQQARQQRLEQEPA
jgi:integrase